HEVQRCGATTIVDITCVLYRRSNKKGVHNTADLETLLQRGERWRSIRIIYFTMFMMSLGFSIILTGVWPFLNKLDPHASKEFLGFVVAANPFAQMLFSPLFGYWGNRSKSVRAPLLLSLSLFTAASAGYALLELFPTSSVRYWMVATRFLVGVGSASITLCRSYLSAATTLRERTGAISMVSLAQVLGFIVGPGVQVLVTPLGDSGVPVFGGALTINMYTAAGWVNVALSLTNLLLFLPCVFRERRIAGREAMRDQGTSSEKETWSGTKPDYVGSWSLICAFFILLFNFVLLETMGAPLVMDQFAWTKEEALYYMGIIMSACAIAAVFTFVAIKPLCRWFNERSVMLYGGFMLMVVGPALCIPWGSSPPKLMISDEVVNGTEPVGCPVSSQPWCAYTPAMTIEQLILGYALTSVGYPIAVTLIQTIFSKLLGPRPQGVWMGIMTGSGCFSRVLGPVFVSFVYARLGTVWTFSLTAVTMALCCLWLRLVKERLVSPDVRSKHQAADDEELHTFQS
ncbi:hypothetical protein B566_EDAN012081, partial [Ephemera danica]